MFPMLHLLPAGRWTRAPHLRQKFPMSSHSIALKTLCFRRERETALYWWCAGIPKTVHLCETKKWRTAGTFQVGCRCWRSRLSTIVKRWQSQSRIPVPNSEALNRARFCSHASHGTLHGIRACLHSGMQMEQALNHLSESGKCVRHAWSVGSRSVLEIAPKPRGFRASP